MKIQFCPAAFYTYQYFLAIEGAERKTTGKTDIDDAKSFALDRKLEVMSRHREGLLAKKVKRMFDYIVDNNFRIDIKDSRFMIEESGNIFSQYPHWDVIRKKSIEFRT